MEAQDPLSQLADIHLPEPVGFWPLAPGWWILAVVVLLTLAFVLFRGWRDFVRHKRQQAALQELEGAYQRYQANIEKADANQAGLEFLYAVNTILKRVALVTDKHNRERLPKLSGGAWLHYLDTTGAADGTFTQGAGQVLAEGLYQPEFRADAGALRQMAKAWIVRRYHEQTQKTAAIEVRHD